MCIFKGMFFVSLNDKLLIFCIQLLVFYAILDTRNIVLSLLGGTKSFVVKNPFGF